MAASLSKARRKPRRSIHVDFTPRPSRPPRLPVGYGNHWRKAIGTFEHWEGTPESYYDEDTVFADLHHYGWGSD